MNFEYISQLFTLGELKKQLRGKTMELTEVQLEYIETGNSDDIIENEINILKNEIDILFNELSIRKQKKERI